MDKVRLDTLLIQRGLAETRHRAQSLILAGQVLVEDRVVDKPGKRVPESAQLAVRERLRFVSRGGVKLEHALDHFGLDVTGVITADIGASTGGFTDCLLQRGVKKVYAVDVGYGQLAWRLRQDPRVVTLERTNVRYLDSLPEPLDLVTIDVSFISLELVLPPVARLLRPTGEIVALVKPQFEAGRDEVSRGGVVKDPAVHRAVLEKTVAVSSKENLRIRGFTPSPLRGPAGNLEFFAYLSRDEGLEDVPINDAIDQCLSEAESIWRVGEAERDE